MPVNSPWQVRIARLVADTIKQGNRRFGRAYATFLEGQAAKLRKAFGPPPSFQARRNPYRVAVTLLRSLGYTTRDIAAILHLSQSAVVRLSKERS